MAIACVSPWCQPREVCAHSREDGSPRDTVEAVGQITEDQHPVGVIAEGVGILLGGVNNCLATEPSLHSDLDRFQDGADRGAHEINANLATKPAKRFTYCHRTERGVGLAEGHERGATHTRPNILRNLPLEHQLEDFGEEPKSLIT